MRHLHKNNLRSVALLIAVACAFAVSLLAQPAQAKTEHRLPAWVWGLWGDSSAWGGYKSPEEGIADWDAYIDQQYEQCLAGPRAAACGSGCSKVNHTNATNPSASTVVNGQPNYFSTTLNISTSYTTACGDRPAQTVVRDLGASSIAMYGDLDCPDPLWSMAVRDPAQVVIDGYTLQSYRLTCQREIPDCPECPTDPNNPKPAFGNPISPIDQTKIENETDYSSADGLLRVRRFYSSAGGGRWTWGDIGISLADFTGRAPSQPTATALSGSIWGSTRTRRIDGSIIEASLPRSFPLLKSQPDLGQKEVWAFLPNGSRTVFTEGATGVFTMPSPGQTALSIATLANGSAQWTLKTRADGYYQFDGTGTLNRHVRLDGKTVSYAQSGNTLTVSASPGERKIVYTKDATSGMYVSALLPDARLITFDVDAFGAVKSVTYPDASVKTYLYNEPTLRGTATEAPVRLTGRVDENGVRQATFTYTNSGNALSTERAGGADKYSIAIPSLNYPHVTLTTPLGSTSTLKWETGPDGERRMTSQSQPAGTGSVTGSQTISYDSMGNVAWKADFAGGLTCHVSDPTRNLETTRVEGLAYAVYCSSVTPDNSTLPAGSRKTTKAWHADWGLASKVSEPSRITTNVYNGQSDPFNGNTVASCAPADALLPDGKPIAVLCKTVQQATTDTDGHLGFTAALQSGVVNRVQSWTYNQYGQILTAKDSLNTTTYAYYADASFIGADPIAVGHTIGDLQTITGPAGQATTFNSYDKSGRILQMTDPKGIVTDTAYTVRGWVNSVTVTPPGMVARTTNYSYDGVGQLIGVSNPDGTTVSYSYDAAHRLIGATDARGNSVAYTLDNMGNRIDEQIKDPSGVLQRAISRSFDALNRLQQVSGAAQ